MTKQDILNLHEKIIDLNMIKQSILYYENRIGELELRRMKGTAGAATRKVGIDKALVTLRETSQRLSKLLKTIPDEKLEAYMKVSQELEAVNRNIRSLEKTQRRHVNVYQFSYEMIDEIKKRVDIPQMLDELGIVKRRSGKARYVVVCPFHDEKTPSCMIYVEDDRYHCFGCQADGDVIDFYQNILDIEFDEALERLVERLGIQFIDEDYVTNIDKEIAECRNKIEQFTNELRETKRQYYKEVHV